MVKKKILQYTEDEFVTLLENIVNRVKKEQRIEESRKARKQRISEKYDRNRNRNSRSKRYR
jgi:phage replication-related protein YjqB (UPF0714/DUF867 family)